MTERDKNAVFSQQAPIPTAGIQTMSAAEKLKQEFGFDLPNELAPLPSCGKTYPANHPLHSTRDVEIAAMTARHEDILSNRAFHKKGTVVTELLKASLADKSINPRDMLEADRNSLLVSIRAAGYGPEYEVEYTCPECEHHAPHMFNLADLKIKWLNIEPVIPGTNEFAFTLPHLKKEVKFKYLTGADVEEITATAEKQKKLGLQVGTSVTTNLLYHLISVNGVTDRGKLASFAANCPARDSAALRKYIRSNEPGLEMKQEVTCPACGHVESQVDIAITAEFFWPGSRD